MHVNELYNQDIWLHYLWLCIDEDGEGGGGGGGGGDGDRIVILCSVIVYSKLNIVHVMSAGSQCLLMVLSILFLS